MCVCRAAPRWQAWCEGWGETGQREGGCIGLPSTALHCVEQASAVWQPQALTRRVQQRCNLPDLPPKTVEGRDVPPQTEPTEQQTVRSETTHPPPSPPPASELCEDGGERSVGHVNVACV